jgi:peptidyl-prolyl cis-trans isomerase D
MLQSMRSKIKGLVAFFLIALLTIPLALVGVENLFNGNTNIGEAAEVNDRVISEREVQIALGRERQRLQSQLGDSLPAEFLSDERLRGPVIEGLVQRSLLASVAEEGNMTFSDQEIDQAILGLPDFQVDGQFDSQRFVQVVRTIGHTPASFRTLMKEDMLVNQMQRAIVATDFITDGEIQRSVALSRQTRDFSWVTLPLGNLVDTATVSEDEISTHYEVNKSTYLSEEQVSIEYIDLNITDIEKEITIDDESIREQYQQFADSFTSGTEREAAHIMIEGDDEAAAEKIATVTQKLAAGEDFSALAAEYSDDFGSRDNGGNLGLSAGDAFPEEFESVLVDLTEGQVSEPIKIDNATHFIQLVTVIEKVPPSYEEQKLVIEAELKRTKAEEQFVQDVQSLEELAYNADSLEQVGEQLGVVMGKTALFTRTSAEAAVLQDSRVVTAAFSEQVVQEKHASDLIELSADRVVVVKLLEHKPVRTLSLEEKRDDILATLKLEKAKSQIASQAIVVREALDAGKDIATVAQENDLTVSTQVAAQRNAVDVPSELLTAIFEMPQPENEQTSLLGQHLGNGDYVIVSLSQVNDGSVEDLAEAEKASLRGNLSSSLSGDEYRAWQAFQREQASVEIYRSAASVDY